MASDLSPELSLQGYSDHFGEVSPLAKFKGGDLIGCRVHVTFLALLSLRACV